jgi:thioredoxin reductase (NADPH)
VSANPADALLARRREQMFPKLDARQIARLEARGTRRRARAGETLVEPGQGRREMLVVLSGRLEVLLPGAVTEQVLTELLPGDFTGELSTLRGVAGFSRIRAIDAGEVLAIGEDALRALVQSDAELSEIIMRAFILRRMGIVASGHSYVTLIGSRYAGNTLRLREFLTRNNYPYVSLDVDDDPGAQALLDRFHVKPDEVPVVVCEEGSVLRNPDVHALAEFLEMNPAVDDAAVHDLVVVGAGPAGLAAAVYGASEGLDVLVVESIAYGGQAGSSSRIENYLGFPTGISGAALAGRAFVQAQKFGANVAVAEQAVRLDCSRRPYAVELSSGRKALAKTVVVASGAKYRAPECAELERFVGLGVYYAATHMEAQLCAGQDAAIVGGGNSAGQAAVFLAASCRHVHILVRGPGLAESMSRYLIRRIEENPKITLHTHTEVEEVHGAERLERVTWQKQGGEPETHGIGHLFLMTGAAPNTAWLQGCVALDEKGFIRTGIDLGAEDLAAAEWTQPRQPFLLETSKPGVFAAGDVRAGSVKRVASAVGEGSSCVQFVHRVLAA